MPTEEAGLEFWDQFWKREGLPPPLRPESPNLSAHLDRQVDGLLRRAAGPSPEGRSFIEVGCGSSSWLPHAATHLQMRVAGIDYSELGVEQAKAMLKREGATGKIVLGDMFSPPDEMRGAFDLVLNNGVVEHFDDTASVLRVIAAFAKPGGRILTVIPNLRGVPGAAQRFLDRSLYDVHVPLGLDALTHAHEQAGLHVEWSEPFMFMNFGVCGFRNKPGIVKKSGYRALVELSRLSWVVETHVRTLKPKAWLAPLFAVIATA